MILFSTRETKGKEKEKPMENIKKRNKRQNEHIKENYDRITATLPKGTIERIRTNGETVNGLVRKLILEWLEEQEKK